jgi:hypothetical protein
VNRYEAGAMTGHELVVKALVLLAPDDPSETLGEIPANTISELRKFLDTYQPGAMLSLHGGAIPTPEQVQAARKWLGTA